MVILRPLEPALDAFPLHAVYGDEASSRYLLDPPTASVAETERRLSRWCNDAQGTDWAILTEEGGEAKGRVTVFKKDGGEWEAAIVICPAARGKGIASRALAQAIDLVDAKAGPRRIMADIDPDNRPSIKLFERLGFQHEGRLRKAFETHIGVRDAVYMSLVDTDPRPWRAG
jgi:RimJ/RimL family protein N-acetyltransferase